MITINLLPQEYRRKERTPLVLLLPILGGLVCVLSAATFAVYVHFVVLGEVVNDREQLEQALAGKQPQLRYEKSLLEEEAEYKKRSDTIQNIASSRILMTKKVDELCEVTVAGDDAGPNDGYFIWLQELKTNPPRATGAARGKKGPKSGGDLVLKGYAIADRDPLQDYNRYHAALKNSEMFQYGFNELSDPSGKIHDFSDDKLPKKGWTIDLTLTMKDPDEARKLREKDAILAEKERGTPK